MQVGKYQLIHKLATGGMAEVFLAKAAGPRGFEKLLVLKRILPHLATEPSFVEMFLSEARLAAQLNHPNIVQIFDFGEAEGTYFLAMEYIDGPNLREIIRRGSSLGLALPIPLCARIIAAACEGLAFAHNFWDLTTGQELNIVHRDISPDNILLSRQGAVKVVDFGIAKAAGLSPHTQTGVLKGKLSYMPPEYLRNETLDGRVDVYSLGVVFYELITGQRPFTAKSEAGMVQAILYEAPVPVVQRRQEVPQAVQRILNKALAKDRDSRYPDCTAFQEDLEEFILSTARPLGAAQLAQLVAMMMAGVEGPGSFSYPAAVLRASGRYAPLQSQLPPAAAAVAPEAPFAPPTTGRAPPPVEALASDLVPTSIERPARLTARFPPAGEPAPLPLLAPLPEPAPEPVPPAPPPAPVPQARAGVPWAAFVGVLLFLAGGGYLLQRSLSEPAVAPPTPAAARVEVPVPPPVSNSKAPAAPPSADPVGEVPSRDGGVEVPAVVPQGRRTEEPTHKNKAPPKPDEFEDELEEESGTLVLQTEPEARVFLDGWQYGKTPLTREIAPGSYTIEFVNDQLGKRVKKTIRITAGQVTLIKVNLFEE
jgi:serine/threonine-protein kinase